MSIKKNYRFKGEKLPSAKSNSAYMAIDNAISAVRQTGNLPVPLHLRNAPTKLMKDLGYHEGYQYSHDYANHFSNQQYLPSELLGTKFWQSDDNPSEQKMQQRMDFIRGAEPKQ